jgi:hypothetical protein
MPAAVLAAFVVSITVGGTDREAKPGTPAHSEAPKSNPLGKEP